MFFKSIESLNKVKLFTLAIIVVFISGCYTLSTISKAKGTGVVKSYHVTVDKAWSEMPSVINAVGLTYVKGDIKERYILAEREGTAFSYGELVGIFFTSIGQQTQIEIVAKPVALLNWGSIFWTWPDAIFKELDNRWNR